ncbi:MAG: hypothetical protein ACI9VR_000614 [Cognaticolwellia sp.]|jgi:hypothetical protein
MSTVNLTPEVAMPSVNAAVQAWETVHGPKKKGVADETAEKAKALGFGGDHLSDRLVDPLFGATMNGPEQDPEVVPRQKSRDLNSLMSSARATEGHFIGLFSDLAARTGGAASFPGVKKLARTKEKIGTKVGDGYGGDAGLVNDLVRGGITYPTVKEAEQGLLAIELLRDTADVKSITGIPGRKQRFEEPEVGYKDIQLKVTMGNGFVVEVQLSAQVFTDAKKAAGHKVYDVVRALEAMEGKGEPLSDQQKLDMAEFKSFSDEIYGKAMALSKESGSVDSDLEAQWMTHPSMRKVMEYKAKMNV